VLNDNKELRAENEKLKTSPTPEHDKKSKLHKKLKNIGFTATSEQLDELFEICMKK